MSIEKIVFPINTVATIQYLFVQHSFDLLCATEMQKLNYKSSYKDTKT